MARITDEQAARIGREITLTAKLEFKLQLTGEETIKEIRDMLVEGFDRWTSEKKGLLLNEGECARRIDMMLQRAPAGRSNVPFWQWPIRAN